METFDKYWEANAEDCDTDKQTAKQIWNAAQRALIRTITKPPFIPEEGDKVRLYGMCHTSFNQVRIVTKVEKTAINVWWIDTKSIERDSRQLFDNEFGRERLKKRLAVKDAHRLALKKSA